MAVAVLLALAVLGGWWTDDPIQIVGHLSNQDVREIRVAVARKIHEPLLPDLSPQSLRLLPLRIGERFWRHPRLWRIERRTDGFAVAVGRAAPDPSGAGFILWSAFRETNAWWVGGEWRVLTYDTQVKEPATP